MITISSDECGVAGLNMVGKGSLDPSIHAQGYGGTYLASPQRTSAADVALFFERLRDGSLLPQPEVDQLRGFLERQQVNDRLPQGLPPGTKLAHKTGDRYGWAHDAGIVHAPSGDYLIVVLSGAWPGKCCYPNPPGEAPPAAFPAIAKCRLSMTTSSRRRPAGPAIGPRMKQGNTRKGARNPCREFRAAAAGHRRGPESPEGRRRDRPPHQRVAMESGGDDEHAHHDERQAVRSGRRSRQRRLQDRVGLPRPCCAYVGRASSYCIRA